MEKRPICPNAFIWRGETYQVTGKISEWQDFDRRGRMSRNMRPEHLLMAKKHGSWGVGRFYFRVSTDSGQIFDLYYDRAPKSSSNRKGGWYLYRELSITNAQ